MGNQYGYQIGICQYVFVGNGFIRSKTCDNHRSSLNGISYAFFASFPIQSTDLKQKEDGMHKCIPYANNNIF